MNTEKEPLRVIRLASQNVMGIKAIEYEVQGDGSIVIVGGANKAGKSSAINSVFWAFTGKPAAKEPIRQGESEAVIEVDLGDSTGLRIKAIRRFWRNTNTGRIESSLRLTNSEGAIYQKPQSMLDDLLAKVSVDPYEFVQKRAAEQVAMIRAALRLDTSDIDAAEADARDRRRLLKDQLLTLEKRNVGMPWHDDAPEQEVDLSQLQAQLEAANEANLLMERQRQEAEAKAQKLRTVDDAIAQQETVVAGLKEQILELERRLAEAEGKLADWKTRRGDVEQDARAAETVAAAATPVDTAPILAAMRELEETNRKVRENKRLKEARAEYAELEAKRVECEKAIEQCMQERKARIAAAAEAANLAVEGLELREDGLFVDGIPFDQINTADQLKLAVALALHENPRIRVFRVKEWGVLDDDNERVLRELAIQYGAQIWAEKVVSRSRYQQALEQGEVSILIEEGEIAAIAPTAEAA